MATFTRQNQTSPLFLLAVALPAGVGAYTVAFLPDQDPSSLPSTVTLADTWRSYPGTYLFLAALPVAPRTFAETLAAFRASPAGAGARFVWLANPDDPLTRWDASWLAATGPAGAWSTIGLSLIPFRNLGLWVGADCVVTLADGATGLVFTPPKGTNGRIYLTAAGGSAILNGVSSPLTLSFEDATAGCLQCSLVLDNSGKSHPPDVDRLDVGLRYFTDSTPPSQVTFGGLSGWSVISYRYPLLDLAPATLTLAVKLDPLNPLLPSRTLFGLPSGTALSTAFLTTTGRTVALTPGVDPGHPAGFALAVRGWSMPSRQTDPYYLVPSGGFGLSEPHPANGQLGPPRLMCGASGVEYLTLGTIAGSTIYFFPGQPAYAPSSAGGAPPGLASGATTAWVYVVSAAPAQAVYHAQPDSSTLFQPIASNSGPGPLFEYLELAGLTLPATLVPTGGGQTLYPMVPLAALTSDVVPASQFELQAISPARRAAITAIANHQREDRPLIRRPLLASPRSATTQATTPQGLLATIMDNRMSLLLGQSQGGTRKLILGDLQPDLADAFQSNQLFLVATDKDALSKLATITQAAGTLTIAVNASDTWTFQVFSEAWNTLQTALVLKFAGKSLLELLSDTSTWVLGAALNGGGQSAVTTVQQRLLAFVQDAIARANNKEEDFALFAALAVDPSWNGILVLNCDVPLDGLPEQISGIAAGIDASLFRAHHLGLTVTPVQVSGTTMTPKDSSLFGLVYYDNPGDIVGTTDDYRFKVLSLKVRFANSSIVSFASTIELLVNALFGDAVELKDGKHGNNLLLNGVYQRHGATGGYIFSTDGDSVFTATSGVIESVEVTRAQFVTVLPAQKQGKCAESRFLLRGNLRFKQLAFDLFSYGDSADGKTLGALSFSNLAIDLSYDPKSPAASSVYRFDATRIVLDIAASTPRPDSLFQSFPLKLTGLIQGLPPDPGDKNSTPTTPSSLGYLGVDVARLPQGALNPPWYGLVAELGLGSAGALAAKAGFTATLLAAWSPGSQVNAGVGLKLPGTGGAKKLLSLESVLKLKIEEIQLTTSGPTYVLNLRNITLSLLSLSFPPSGQTELGLFADPSGQDHTTLGWYAAYAKAAPKKKQLSAPPVRALPPGDPT
jgi:hypothetical protein